MASNQIASLAQAGILIRSRAPGRLRVSPRFLAHAEGTAGRLRLQGDSGIPRSVIAHALATWDGFTLDAHQAAGFLTGFLADRDQLGQVMPVFAVIESFAAA